MWKIVKNEYKSVVILPVLSVLAGIIYIIVAAIEIKLSDTYNDYASYSIISNMLGDLLIGLSILVAVGVFVPKSTKSADIYKLTDTKDWQLIATRALMLFTLIAGLTLYFECVFTLEAKLCADKFGNGQNAWFNESNYALYGLPFASWLTFLAVGLWSVLLYAIVLASASVLRLRELNRYVKYVLAAGLVAALIFCFVAIAPLITNALSFADFNVNAEGHGLIPRSNAYMFNSGKATSVRRSLYGLNIFSLGELFFTFVFIGICYLIYSVGYRRSHDSDEKRFRKWQTAVVTVVAVFAVGTTIFGSVLSSEPRVIRDVFDDGYYGMPRVHELGGSVGEEIDLSEYRLDECVQIKNYTTTVRYERQPPQNSNPDVYETWNYDTDAIKLTNGGKTLTASEEGFYVMWFSVRNKFTKTGHMMFFEITITQAE